MFKLTSDLKYRVASNFVSQTQDDGEEMSPDKVWVKRFGEGVKVDLGSV